MILSDVLRTNTSCCNSRYSSIALGFTLITIERLRSHNKHVLRAATVTSAAALGTSQTETLDSAFHVLDPFRDPEPAKVNCDTRDS